MDDAVPCSRHLLRPLWRLIAWALLALLSACAPEDPQPARSPVSTRPSGRVDSIADGWALADRWVADGRPDASGGPLARPEYEIFTPRPCCIHCRTNRSRDCCGSPWSRSAVESPAAFASELLKRRDVELTKRVVTNVGSEHGVLAAIPLVRELDADEPLWRAAIAALVAEPHSSTNTVFEPGDFARLAHEVWRHASSAPVSRGFALSLLATLSGQEYCEERGCPDIVDWKHFGTWSGTALRADDLGGYLDEGPTAWRAAGKVCPAFRGKLHTDALRSRLDDASADAILGVSECLCSEGDTGGILELATYLRRRGANDPLSRDARVARELQASSSTCARTL